MVIHVSALLVLGACGGGGSTGADGGIPQADGGIPPLADAGVVVAPPASPVLDQVTWRDNDRNLDASALPVPDANIAW